MTTKQEIRELNKKVDILSKKFDLLIDVLSVGLKSELIAANELHALEIASLIKKVDKLSGDRRMADIELFIKENKNSL